jgi:hypothetical protein
MGSVAHRYVRNTIEYMGTPTTEVAGRHPTAKAPRRRGTARVFLIHVDPRAEVVFYNIISDVQDSGITHPRQVTKRSTS